MTPAITEAKKLGLPVIIHKYNHDPNHDSFGREAAEKLGLSESQVFKTLLAELDDGTMAMALVPVSEKLSLKSLAKAAGCKKSRMADKRRVESATGYVLGGVSPLGQRGQRDQKKKTIAFIDISAKEYNTVFVSGGQRGVEIEVAPTELAKSINARFTDLC